MPNDWITFMQFQNKVINDSNIDFKGTGRGYRMKFIAGLWKISKDDANDNNNNDDILFNKIKKLYDEAVKIREEQMRKDN